MGVAAGRPGGGEAVSAPTRTARRSKYAVHFLVEDGFVVRGTLDPHEALALAVGEDDHFSCEGPGCQSVDDHDQWMDESGLVQEGCSYGCH